MKKILVFMLQLMLIFQFTGTCFAKSNRDCSQMCGGVLNMPAIQGEIVQYPDNSPTVQPPSLSLENSAVSDYDKMYTMLCNTFTSEKINAFNSSNILPNENYYYIDSSDMLFSLPRNSCTVQEIYAILDEKWNTFVLVYRDFFVDHPELFFLSNGCTYKASYSSQKINITFLPMLYTDYDKVDIDITNSSEFIQFIKTGYNTLTDTIRNIANSLKFDGMSDYDKLLLAHDYITDNCAYYLVQKNNSSYYGDDFSYNAYGTLVFKEAVCQGYSLAYIALLKELGYNPDNIKTINSTTLNHMWNFVKLNGKWYHIDSTWDDPISKNYDMKDLSKQVTYHDYFLISDNTNANLRNSDFDMIIRGKNSSANSTSSAVDTSYESGYIYQANNNMYDGVVKHDKNGYMLYPNIKISASKTPQSMRYSLNSLKATKYIISQPFTNDSNAEFVTDLKNFKNVNSRISACNESVLPNKKIMVCYSFYDSNNRFISAETTQKTISANLLNLSPEKDIPKNAAKMKILFIDGLTPISNTPILTSIN